MDVENGMILNDKYEPSREVCDCCGKTLWYNDKYYDIDDKVICEDCIDSYIQDFLDERLTRVK